MAITIMIMAIMPVTAMETAMFDDFFTRALVAGIGLALTVGPLGCFIVWRRMAYFGDTMAHSALLGVALSFLFQIDLTIGVFVVAAMVSIVLLMLQKRGALSTDALLGILSHSTLALGLVMVAFMTWIRVDLMGFLFGDILAVSRIRHSRHLCRWPADPGSGGVAVAAASGVHRQRGTGRGRRPFAGTLPPYLHADDGAGHRHCHEDRRHPADHRAADHSRGNRAPLRRHARTDGGAGFTDRGGGRHRRAFRLAALRHAVRSVHRGFGSVPLHSEPLARGISHSACIGWRRSRPMSASPDLTRNQSLVLNARKGGTAAVGLHHTRQLRDDGFRAPLQVYRALDKLLAAGLVHRLESINSFVACAHPHPHVHGMAPSPSARPVAASTNFRRQDGRSRA
jgi:hypothetical protein